jgi:hypothetical protein
MSEQITLASVEPGARTDQRKRRPLGVRDGVYRADAFIEQLAANGDVPVSQSIAGRCFVTARRDGFYLMVAGDRGPAVRAHGLDDDIRVDEDERH